MLLKLRDISQNNLIQKSKVYLAGRQPPEGVKVHQGPRGKPYYMSEDLKALKESKKKDTPKVEPGEKKKRLPAFRKQVDGSVMHRTKEGEHGPGAYRIESKDGEHHLTFEDKTGFVQSLGKHGDIKELKRRVAGFKGNGEEKKPAAPKEEPPVVEPKVNEIQPPVAAEPSSVSGFVVSGKTYPLKNEIKSQFGGVWNKDKGGWLVHGKHADALKSFADTHGLDLEDIIGDVSTFKKLEGEELRAARQEAADRKATTLRSRASKLESEVETKRKQFSDLNGKLQYEPIKVGHHSEKRHRKAVGKLDALVDGILEGSHNVVELNKRADSIQSSVRVKGDAESAKEKVREEMRNKIIVGKTKVWSHLFRKEGLVTKLNKKSASVYYPEMDETFTEQLHHIKYIGE